MSVLILFTGVIFSQNSFGPVVTFDPDLCRKGVKYNNMTQDDKGIIYFATDKGLMKYDGANYSLTSVEGNNAIHSILYNNGKIFAGLSGNFGFFETDDFGTPHFISLADSLVSVLKGEKISKIGEISDGILFEGNNHIFRYNDEKRELKELTDLIIKPDGKLDSLHDFNIFNVNGEIYAQNHDGDFYKFSKDGWSIYWQSQRLGNNRIAEIVTPGNFRRSTPRIPDESVILLKSGEVLKVVDGLPVNITSADNETVKSLTVTTGLKGPDNCIYIGSEEGGVIRLDQKGEHMGHITTSEGLANNSVNSLFTDRDNNIWVTHSGGVSLIHTGMPIEVAYSAESSTPDLPGKTLSSEVLWNGEYFLIKLSDLSMIIYKKEADKQLAEIKTIDIGCIDARQFEAENNGTLWFAHHGGGVTKARLAPDGDGLVNITYYPALDDENKVKDIRVMKLRGKTVFRQGSDFFIYEEESNSFRHAEKLSGELLSKRDITGAWQVNESQFWIASPESYDLIAFNEDYTVDFTLPLELFQWGAELDNPYIETKEAIIYIPVKGGIARINNSRGAKQSLPKKMQIDYIGSFDRKGNFHRLPVAGKGKIKTSEKNITVAVNYPEYDYRPLRYRFVLKGGGATTDTITTIPVMTFNSLQSGSYDLLCEVIGPDGNVSDGVVYHFKVTTPWPLRWWAWVIYAGVLACVVWLLAGMQLKMALHSKERQFSESKSRQDAMIKEQALIIANQGKKMHEKRLSTKSKELAEIIPTSRGRQIALDNILETLSFKREKGEDTVIAEKVLKEISSSGSDNRIFWDIFHKHFDLIHEAYFHAIKEEYPALTAADLKFCALLRMGMTTKEVSKFTDLSVRGVETARYRLRKKFGLSGEQSLTEFLAGPPAPSE